MTVVLEQEIAVGGTMVAALVRKSISANHSGRHVSVTASKTPIVLLFRRDDDVTAFSMLGEPVPLSQVDDLCPGAVADFISTNTA